MQHVPSLHLQQLSISEPERASRKCQATGGAGEISALYVYVTSYHYGRLRRGVSGVTTDPVRWTAHTPASPCPPPAPGRPAPAGWSSVGQNARCRGTSVAKKSGGRQSTARAHMRRESAVKSRQPHVGARCIVGVFAISLKWSWCRRTRENPQAHTAVRNKPLPTSIEYLRRCSESPLQSRETACLRHGPPGLLLFLTPKHLRRQHANYHFTKSGTPICMRCACPANHVVAPVFVCAHQFRLSISVSPFVSHTETMIITNSVTCLVSCEDR